MLEAVIINTVLFLTFSVTFSWLALNKKPDVMKPPVITQRREPIIKEPEGPNASKVEAKADKSIDLEKELNQQAETMKQLVAEVSAVKEKIKEDDLEVVALKEKINLTMRAQEQDKQRIVALESMLKRAELARGEAEPSLQEAKTALLKIEEIAIGIETALKNKIKEGILNGKSEDLTKFLSDIDTLRQIQEEALMSVDKGIKVMLASLAGESPILLPKETFADPLADYIKMPVGIQPAPVVKSKMDIADIVVPTAPQILEATALAKETAPVSDHAAPLSPGVSTPVEVPVVVAAAKEENEGVNEPKLMLPEEAGMSAETEGELATLREKIDGLQSILREETEKRLKAEADIEEEKRIRKWLEEEEMTRRKEYVKLAAISKEEAEKRLRLETELEQERKNRKGLEEEMAQRSEYVKLAAISKEEAEKKLKLEAELEQQRRLRRKLEEAKETKTFEPVAQMKEDTGGAGSYTVKKGDSLWKIASKPDVYNNPYLWPLLFKYNREVVKKPSRIKIGDSLIINRDISREENEDAIRKAKKHLRGAVEGEIVKEWRKEWQ